VEKLSTTTKDCQIFLKLFLESLIKNNKPQIKNVNAMPDSKPALE